MKTSTKRGDQGITDIKGKRIKKTDPIIEALGCLDELMAEMILLAALFPDNKEDLKIKVEQLSLISAILAGYADAAQFNSQILIELEKEIEVLEKNTEQFQFVYPFNSEESARWNLIRSKARKVERTFWHLEENQLPSALYCYLNRLSDWLFLKGCSV